MSPQRKIDPQTKEHIERFLAGKEVWNDWARDMLARKEKLVEEGKWQVKRGIDFLWRHRDLSHNPEVQAWLDEAYLDFSSLIFKMNQNENRIDKDAILFKAVILNFSHFIFPYETTFVNSQFFGGIDFFYSIFYDSTNFSSAKFKDRVVFSGSNFCSDAYFYNSRFYDEAIISGAIFKQEASFDNSILKNSANFSSTKFFGKTSFSDVKFKSVLSFHNVTFENDATFMLISSKKIADFREATFKGRALFREASFQGNAFFRLARFKKQTDFAHVDFLKSANFSEVKFFQSVSFEAIEVKRAFSLADAQFLRKPPNFSQAHFSESPRLDHVEVQPFIKKKSPFSWQRYFWQERFLPYLKRGVYRAFLFNPLNSWRGFCNSDRNLDDEAYYRALKRLAIQAHDHENEMKFFAGELRSRRFVRDFPYQQGLASGLRYLFGVLYEITSDFGRSIWRPAVWWGATFALFASLYLANANPAALEKCEKGKTISALAAAKTIAAKNSLPFFNLDRVEKLKRSYGCLYGAAPLYHPSYYAQEESGQPKAHTTSKSPPTRRFHMAPAVPWWVTVLGVLNMVLSLIFLFLLLLAIRNQFRIK